MTRACLAVLSLCLIASPLTAQRGGGGGGGRTFGKTPDADYGSLRASGVRLSTGDVEDMSPVKLLLDKRKDLKLSDDQQKQLRAMADQLKEANRPSFKTLDSLRSESRPRVDADATVEQVRTELVREQMRAVVGTIRESYKAALTGALGLLDESQRAKVDGLVQKQSIEADEVLKDKLGASRGGRGSGRGGPPA